MKGTGYLMGLFVDQDREGGTLKHCEPIVPHFTAAKGNPVQKSVDRVTSTKFIVNIIVLWQTP